MGIQILVHPEGFADPYESEGSPVARAWRLGAGSAIGVGVVVALVIVLARTGGTDTVLPVESGPGYGSAASASPRPIPAEANPEPSENRYEQAVDLCPGEVASAEYLDDHVAPDDPRDPDEALRRLTTDGTRLGPDGRYDAKRFERHRAEGRPQDWTRYAYAHRAEDGSTDIVVEVTADSRDRFTLSALVECAAPDAAASDERSASN